MTRCNSHRRSTRVKRFRRNHPPLPFSLLTIACCLPHKLKVLSQTIPISTPDLLPAFALRLLDSYLPSVFFLAADSDFTSACPAG